MFSSLRSLRKEHNASPDMLAKVIGVKTVGAYYKKETGKIEFSLKEAKALSDFFDMPIERIFFTSEVSNMETKAV